MAHKKGVGSSRNGRDSNAQRLGVKRFAGQQVTSIQSKPKIYSSFINMTLKTSPLLFILSLIHI